MILKATLFDTAMTSSSRDFSATVLIAYCLQPDRGTAAPLMMLRRGFCRLPFNQRLQWMKLMNYSICSGLSMCRALWRHTAVFKSLLALHKFSLCRTLTEVMPAGCQTTWVCPLLWKSVTHTFSQWCLPSRNSPVWYNQLTCSAR